MYRNIKIEAENNELILKNSKGSHVIIPANKRDWVKARLKANDHQSIDELVSKLPVASNYAEDGTIVPADIAPEEAPGEPISRHLVEPLEPLPSRDIAPEFKKNDSLYRQNEKNPNLAVVAEVPYAREPEMFEPPMDTEYQITTPLPEATITDSKPSWLLYDEEYRKTKTKEAYIDSKLTPFARAVGNSKDKYSSAWDRKYEEQVADYVSEQIAKNNPQGDRSRVDYLNSLSDKEEEYLKRNPRYQTNLWGDAKRGIQSLFTSNPMGRFAYVMNDSSLSQREKRERLSQFADSPIMSHMEDIMKTASVLGVGSKLIQSIYKKDYSVSDALSGTKNDASLPEELLTDPLNILGFPGISRSLASGMSRSIIKTIETIEAIAEEGNTLVNNFNRGMKAASGEKGVLNAITDADILNKDALATARDIIKISSKNKDKSATMVTQLKLAYESSLSDEQLTKIFNTNREQLVKQLDSLDPNWRLQEADRKKIALAEGKKPIDLVDSRTRSQIDDINTDRGTYSRTFVRQIVGEDNMQFINPERLHDAGDPYIPVAERQRVATAQAAADQLPPPPEEIIIDVNPNDVRAADDAVPVRPEYEIPNEAEIDAYWAEWEANRAARSRELDYEAAAMEREANEAEQAAREVDPATIEVIEQTDEAAIAQREAATAQRRQSDLDTYNSGLVENGNYTPEEVTRRVDIYERLSDPQRGMISNANNGSYGSDVSRDSYVNMIGEEATSLINPERFATEGVDVGVALTNSEGKISRVTEVIRNPKELAEQALVNANDNSFNLGKKIKTFINNLKGDKEVDKFVGMMPKDARVKNMLTSLFMEGKSQKEILEIIKGAFRSTLAEKSGNFRATDNLSDCSAPLYYAMAEKASKEKDVSFAMNGFIELNNYGFLKNANVSNEDIVKYINTGLKGKKYGDLELPAAYLEGGKIMIPDLIIRKGALPAMSIGLFINATQEGDTEEQTKTEN